MEKYNNKILDSNYTKQLKFWWYVNHISRVEEKQKKKWIFQRMIDFLFFNTESKKKTTLKIDDDWLYLNMSLEWQLRKILTLPDKKYTDKLLSSELRKYITEIENWIKKANIWIKEKISPSVIDIKINELNVSWMFSRTYYANAYPSTIDYLWTRQLLDIDHRWDASWFIYPSERHKIEWVLKKRATMLKAELWDSYEKWKTVDAELEVEYHDVQDIRQKLATWEEKYFQNSFYVTLYSEYMWTDQKVEQDENLNLIAKKFEQKMESMSINVKRAAFRMDEWFTSTLPICIDDLWIYRSMLSTSLGGSFPFISNDLIDETWILYGQNLHTWSLVIFDRFGSKLPNANSIVLATSWAWKSFTVKLEILRYLLLNTDIIVIDPENEYKELLERVWGTYINVSVNSHQYINPFELPPMIEDRDYRKWDLLRWKIMELLGIISVMIGWLTPEEEAILDTAIQNTYTLKEIDFENEDPTGKEAPLMQDLLDVLEWMDWAKQLSLKVSKYVTWSFGNLFNNHTNIDLWTWLTVFSIRDLEEQLKTPAMHNILTFIWNRVRAKKQKRLLIIDEAWIMMQHEMAANFLFGLIKRARKYKLWVTTITQDVEDFLNSPYWKPIVSNAALQVLLKQSASSIKTLDKIFPLSDTEKNRLVSSNVWEWLFLAGNQHVAIKILASPYERDFITT